MYNEFSTSNDLDGTVRIPYTQQRNYYIDSQIQNFEYSNILNTHDVKLPCPPNLTSHIGGFKLNNSESGKNKNNSRSVRLSHSADSGLTSKPLSGTYQGDQYQTDMTYRMSKSKAKATEDLGHFETSSIEIASQSINQEHENNIPKDVLKSMMNLEPKANDLVPEETDDPYDCGGNGLSNSNALGLIFTSDDLGAAFTNALLPQLTLPKPYDIQFQNLGNYPIMDPQSNTLELRVRDRSSSRSPYDIRLRSKEGYPTEKKTRYVTELKMNLRGGRAQRVVRNWKTASSDGDSASETGDDLIEDPSTQVKAVLCRANKQSTLPRMKSNRFEVQQQQLRQDGQVEIKLITDNGCANNLYFPSDPGTSLSPRSKIYPDQCDPDLRLKDAANEDTSGFGLPPPNCPVSIRQETSLGSELRSPSENRRSHSNFSVRITDSSYDSSITKHLISPKRSHRPDISRVNLMTKAKSVSPSRKGTNLNLDGKPIELSGSHSFPSPKQAADTLSSGLDMDSPLKENPYPLKGMPTPPICTLVKQGQNNVSSEDVSALTGNSLAPNASPQVDEPSNKTLVEGCSACTIISPKDGKTSRGTQSELVEQVKIVRDMQIQTLQEESDPIEHKQVAPLPKPAPLQSQSNRTSLVLTKPAQPVSRLPVLTTNFWNNDWRPMDHIEPIRNPNSAEETPDQLIDPEHGSAITVTPSSFLVYPQRACPNPLELKHLHNKDPGLNKPAACSGDYTFTTDMITNETNTVVGDSFPETMGVYKKHRGEPSCPNDFRDPLRNTNATGMLGRAKQTGSPKYRPNIIPTKEPNMPLEDGKGDIRDSKIATFKPSERPGIMSKSRKITSSPTYGMRKKYSPPMDNQVRNYGGESNGVVIVEENSTPTPWRLCPERHRNDSHYVQSQRLGCTAVGNSQITRTIPQGLRVNSPNESLESCVDECCACIHHESTSETHTYSCDCCQMSGHPNEDRQRELRKLKMKNQVVSNRMKEKEHICSIVCEPSYVASNVKLPTDPSVSKSVYDYTDSHCSCCRSTVNTHTTASHCFQRFSGCRTKENNDSMVANLTPHAYNHIEQHHQDCNTGHQQYGQKQQVRRMIQPRVMQPPPIRPVRLSSPTQQHKQSASRPLSPPHLGTRQTMNFHESDMPNRCNNQSVNFTFAGQKATVETQVIHSSVVKKDSNLTEDPPVQIKPQQTSELFDNKQIEDPNKKSAVLTKDPQVDALFKMVGEKEKRNILQRWLLEQLAYSTKKTAPSANYKVLPSSTERCQVNNTSPNRSETEEETESDTVCSCSECQAQGDVTSSSSQSKFISDGQNPRPNTSSEISASSSQCTDSLVSGDNQCEYPITRGAVSMGRPTKFAKVVGSTSSRNLKTNDGRSGESEFLSRQQVQRSIQQHHQQQQQSRQMDRLPDRRATSSSINRFPADRIPFNHKPRAIQRSARLRNPATGVTDSDRGDRSVSKIRTAERQNQGNATSKFVIKGQSREKPGDGENQVKVMDPWIRYGRNIFEHTPGTNNRPPSGQFKKNRMGSTTDKIQQQQQQVAGNQSLINHGINSKTLRTNSATLESRGLSSSRVKADYPGRLGDNGLRVTGHHSTERTGFECERIYELSPYDDLVKSHLNMADRRIKAVATKNGCEIVMNGPITTSDSSLNILNGRTKVIYQCHVFGSSEDRISKCVNFLKETFPNSFIRSNWRA